MKHNTFTDSSCFCLVVLPVLLVLQDVSSGRPLLRRTLEGILPWQRTGPHQLPLQSKVHKLFIDMYKHSLSLSPRSPTKPDRYSPCVFPPGETATLLPTHTPSLWSQEWDREESGGRAFVSFFPCRLKDSVINPKLENETTGLSPVQAVITQATNQCYVNVFEDTKPLGGPG